MPSNDSETKARRQAAEAEARGDIRALFGSDLGQRVLGRLHAAAGTNRPRFIPGTDGSIDTHAAAFADGQAEIVNAIQRTLDSPEDEDQARPKARR